MFNRSSFAANESGDLSCIWHVHGDDQYDSRIRRDTDSRMVAIRTLAGAGALELDGPGLVIVAADTILVTETRRLRYYGTYTPPWRFYWSEFSRECGLGLPMDDVIQVAPTGWEEPLLDHIFTQLCLPDSSAQASATALFRALLCHWTAAHAANGPSSNAAKELVRKAAERYNAFRMESMNLDNLAAELGVGSRRLRQAFAQELGISPKRYFTTVRLRQAAQALKMGRGNVTQIAEQVGYASPFHFSRAFKAEFGCSPSDYVQARQTRAKGG